MSITIAQVQFNPIKHHFNFIYRSIVTAAAMSGELAESLFEPVKSINANFIDIYTGVVSPEEIKEKIAGELSLEGISDEGSFVHWLGEKGYQLISLKDDSVWVLRKSEYKSAFVHIHPSRKPPMTIRVHGNAFRTVVGLLLIYPEFLKEIPTLEVINSFRKEKLSLSPVKSTHNLKRVMDVYQMFKQPV